LGLTKSLHPAIKALQGTKPHLLIKLTNSMCVPTRTLYVLVYTTHFPSGFLVGKSEGKSPLDRPRPKLVDNITIILDRYDGVVWAGLVWLRIGTGGELL
jgi:hypothetical protein